jgi:hypothetical protein
MLAEEEAMSSISGVGKSTQPFFRRVSRELSPERLKTLPSRAKEGIREQLKDNSLLLWGGMIYVPGAILTPIVLNWDLKHKKEISADERHLLTSQEVIRQIVSAITYWVTYYGGILLTGLGLKENTSHRAVKQLLGAALFTAIGSGILRPMITNAFLAKHASRDKQQNPFAKKVT